MYTICAVPQYWGIFHRINIIYTYPPAPACQGPPGWEDQVFPQTDLSERGSHAVGKGPLANVGLPWWNRGAYIVVKTDANSMVPSKPPREIESLKELLHSSREAVKVYEIWPPDASQMPPQPPNSKMPPKCFPNTSQMFSTNSMYIYTYIQTYTCKTPGICRSLAPEPNTRHLPTPSTTEHPLNLKETFLQRMR